MRYATLFQSILAAAPMMVLAALQPCGAQQNPAGLAKPNTARVTDVFLPTTPGQVRFTGGMLGDRYRANELNRMLKVDENEMLDGFEQRLKPHQDWAGEHVGKWLHAAGLTWAATHNPELKRKIERVVSRLIRTQEADGYLGTYKPDHRWTSWDVWVHKYDLIGLLTVYQYLGDKSALDASRKVGDLLLATFGTDERDINRAGEHMGMAADSVLEPIILLYRSTSDDRYLNFARYIVANYDAPGGPEILASLEKFRSVRKVANAKAYEMTSNLNGLLELYRVTGETRLLNDMRIAWNDIAHNRLYITGSASSYEVFQDNYHFPETMHYNICETCVTVTWEQMNLQLLRLTGEAAFADQVERTVYNHLLGAQKPTGDDWAYYTPLEGHKPYDNFTTCCHSSGPRGIALLPEFAYMTTAGAPGIVVNLYNSSEFDASLPGVGMVRVTQATSYPLDGHVHFIVAPARSGTRFSMLLRIPGGLASPRLAINGKSTLVNSGDNARYVTITRAWKSGDRVDFELPIQNRLIVGDHGDEGKAALMAGPLVLALDSRLNPGLGALNRIELASDQLSRLHLERASSTDGGAVFTALAKAADGKTCTVRLSPYADAGSDGKSIYTVWIARPGNAKRTAGPVSAFSGASSGASRRGNNEGSFVDDDPDTFSVTFNDARLQRDWFAVMRDTPVLIDRVVYMHGKSFHDGGWFDASREKPLIEAQRVKGGPWVPFASLSSYPATTSTDYRGIQDGQRFEARFEATTVYGIRIVGFPASGDNPAQNFASCAELQAFGPRK